MKKTVEPSSQRHKRKLNPYYQMERSNIVNMPFLPKFIFKLEAVPSFWNLTDRNSSLL
jgi:hypothetical protein